MSSEVDPEASVKKMPGTIRTALWLSGGALFGSLALVLWNRKALTSLRKAAAASGKPVRLPDDGIY